MALECPICRGRLDTLEPTCPGCGFPVALHPEALRALDEEDEETAMAAPAARAAPAHGAAVAISRPRELAADSCGQIARSVQGHMALLKELGGNTVPFAVGLRQAALVQSEGKVAESLELLRAAETEAERAVSELFAQRSQELESRAALLHEEGVVAESEETMQKLHAALSASDRAEAARLAVDLDRRLGALERDWRGLHSLLQQILDLQAGAREAGRPIPEVESDLQAVQNLLTGAHVDAPVIDSASQIAARALMMLHESLPDILEKDLDRHGAVLSAYPSEHEPSRRAKALHSEVTRHLRRARLTDASKGLSELRREIRRLETMPAAERAPPAVEPPKPEAPAEEALPRLLAKARTLASRVRALAPDSDVAFEAAGEIRRATELLKARQLDEAEAALSRLMRTLDAAPPEDR